MQASTSLQFPIRFRKLSSKPRRDHTIRSPQSTVLPHHFSPIIQHMPISICDAGLNFSAIPDSIPKVELETTLRSHDPITTINCSTASLLPNHSTHANFDLRCRPQLLCNSGFDSES